jgi:exosome complex RNA-binding protein Rrp42 (RNase PH superfamily)
MSRPLSSSERGYIERGIQLGVRNDGRTGLSMRRVRVVLNELPHSHGSARCVVGASATEVLVSVKAELVSLLGLSSPPAFVECAAQTLVGGSGAAEDSALAAALQALLGGPNVFPADALTVVPGRWQWRLLVDALVLAEDGGVLDAASVAAAAALRATRLPALRVLRSGGPPPAPEAIDLELNDDPGAAWAIPSAAASIPLALTLHYIKGLAVVDASAEEVACATASACIGINPSGQVTYLQTSGKEGLPTQELGIAIAAAQKLVPVLVGFLGSGEASSTG